MDAGEQIEAIRKSHKAGHTGMLGPADNAVGNIEKAKDKIIVAIAQCGDTDAGREQRLREVFRELEKTSAYLIWVLKNFP